jgi:hypothetical protein
MGFSRRGGRGAGAVVGAIALAIPTAEVLADTAVVLGVAGSIIDGVSCVKSGFHDALACTTAARGALGVGAGIAAVGKLGEGGIASMSAGSAALIGTGFVAGPSAASVDATVFFAPPVPCGS